MATLEPTLFVIVGGAGDLTRRKLLPAIARLVEHNAWQTGFHVLAVGRRDQTDESHHASMVSGAIPATVKLSRAHSRSCSGQYQPDSSAYW